MSGEALWDVWLLGFTSGADPIAGLVRLFGMTEVAARHIEMTLPRAMKRNLSRPEAENLLADLLRIGAKAEVREHRAESARRSMSQPQMEAVGASPPIVISSAPPRAISSPGIPAQIANPPAAQIVNAPEQPRTTPQSTPAIVAGPPVAESGAPLGSPVSGELSKTPRNIMMVVAAIFAIGLLGVVAASLSSDDEEVVVAPPEAGTPDAEAAALMEARTQEARVFMNNSRSTFSGADPDAIITFINNCYVAGATRVLVADLNNVGGVDFAGTLLVQLPDEEEKRSGVRDAYAQTFLDRNRWDAEDGDPEGFGEHWFVVSVR